MLLRPIGLDTLATEVWKLTSLGAYSRGRGRRARVLLAISAVRLRADRAERIGTHGTG